MPPLRASYDAVTQRAQQAAAALLERLGYVIVHRDALFEATGERDLEGVRRRLAESCPAPRDDAAAEARERIHADGEFGARPFEDLAWLFAARRGDRALLPRRVDEAALLYRAARLGAGPILQVGRAGATTVLLLAASGARPLVSVDPAPLQHPLLDEVFRRPDVARRLALRVQSPRLPLPEQELGLLVLDGDPSYAEVSRDLAAHWGALRAHDGRPALALLHRGAAAPREVQRAIDELLAEPGACRVVATAGTSTLVEKTGALDAEAWRQKADAGFWAGAPPPGQEGVELRSVKFDPARLRAGAGEGLPTVDLADPRWGRRGVRVVASGGQAAVHPEREQGEHWVEARCALAAPATFVELTARARPVHGARLRLRLARADERPLALADFDLSVAPPRLTRESPPGAVPPFVSARYEAGYYTCRLVLPLPEALDALRARIQVLRGDGAVIYPGDPGAGVVIGGVSLRPLEDVAR